MPDVRIGDDALMCFARWCRLNEARFVLDPVILRRVFEAYAAQPDVVVEVNDA